MLNLQVGLLDHHGDTRLNAMFFCFDPTPADAPNKHVSVDFHSIV